MVQITSREELEAWLEDKPVDFAQVIAARSALRVLPFAFNKLTSDKWVKWHSLALFHASAIAWSARIFPTHDMAVAAAFAGNAAEIARAAAGAVSARPNTACAAYVADAARSAVRVVHSSNFAPDAAGAAGAASTAAYAAGIAAGAAFDSGSMASASIAAAYAHPVIWTNVGYDCTILAADAVPFSAAERLARQRLWLTVEPDGWSKAWVSAIGRLAALNQGYIVWIDWYNRRVEGHDAAFNIPGDTDRAEDKAILARLADATEEHFWVKGAKYVNTTLQSWIDEARERVAAKTTPPQESDALTYGVNADGKLDRLPSTDQQHLRDAPDQQRIYRDVREAALELQQEGQRLGARLEKALGRFVASLPESFAAAECYSVWRDGNSLRRIHLAHRAVAGGTDYDDKRLDPAMAEMLGDVLDRYNLFAFGDDGLRAKDEAAIPPQEREKAEEEAGKAAPLVDAMLDAPEIMTEIVRDDIVADKADRALPKGDAFDDQVRVQSNKSMRNRIAGLLTGVAQQIKQSAKSVREGAERAVGAFVVSDAAGVTNVHGPILTFAITHLAKLKAFAETAYANFSLQWLWDALAKLREFL